MVLLAWAVPTKYGQYVKGVSRPHCKTVILESLDEKDNVWFRGSFNLKALILISSSDDDISKTLITLKLSRNKISKSEFL